MIFTDGYKLNIINNSTLLVACRANHWVTIININANNRWTLYDSLNNTNNLNNLKPLFKKIKTAEKTLANFNWIRFPTFLLKQAAMIVVYLLLHTLSKFVEETILLTWCSARFNAQPLQISSFPSTIIIIKEAIKPKTQKFNGI